MKIITTYVALQFDLEDDIEFDSKVVQTQIEMMNETLSTMFPHSQPQLNFVEDSKIIVMDCNPDDE